MKTETETDCLKCGFAHQPDEDCLQSPTEFVNEPMPDTNPLNKRKDTKMKTLISALVLATILANAAIANAYCPPNDNYYICKGAEASEKARQDELDRYRRQQEENRQALEDAWRKSREMPK